MKASYAGLVLGALVGVIAGAALAYFLWEFHPLRWIAAGVGGLFAAVAFWLLWLNPQRGQGGNILGPGGCID